MDPQKTQTQLTEYELRRLENIRRNNQMLASLIPNHISTPAPTPNKRVKTPKPESDSENSSSKLEPDSDSLRRSRRRLGIPPSASPPPSRRRSLAACTSTNPLSFSDALISTAPYYPLVSAIKISGCSDDEGGVKKMDDPRDGGMELKGDKLAKVGNGSMMTVRFLPLSDRRVVVVGNRIGDLGFWDVDFFAKYEEIDDEDGNGLYLFKPHSNQVSGISVSSFNPRKIFTSSMDGSVRSMDIEKETFNMLLSSEQQFYSINQCPQNINSVYIGEGAGILRFWDEREGKTSLSWKAHSDRINSIDFDPKNKHIMVTSSTDRLCCLWDMRSMKKDFADPVKTLSHHEGAVHSAYFSPSGNCLATTSGVRGEIGIVSGSNFEDQFMISHANWNCNLSSPFKAIWGSDDDYLFIGSKKRAINVISTIDKKITSLKSAYMTSIPCKLAYIDGYLAGATTEGKVYLWTKR